MTPALQEQLVSLISSCLNELFIIHEIMNSFVMLLYFESDTDMRGVTGSIILLFSFFFTLSYFQVPSAYI